MQTLEELGSELEAAGNRPGLDQGEPLPGLAGRDVIIFDARKRMNKRDHGAFGPEAHVDPKEEAVACAHMSQPVSVSPTFVKIPPS